MSRHGVIMDGFFRVNNVDLSAGVRRIDYELNADAQDDWAFGDGAQKKYAPGGVDWSVRLEAYQDYALAKLNATMRALIIGRTTFNFTIGRDSTTVDQDNPRWSGSGMVESYQPMQGAKNENAFAALVIRPAGANNNLTEIVA